MPESPCAACGGVLQGPGPVCLSCLETREQARPVSPPDALALEIPGFQILREIGSGGMGTVYEAVDTKLRRRVALKVMSKHRASSENAQVRFAREAWIGGKLSHPNLVKVFEMGSAETVSFFTMELCDGGSLHDVATRMRRNGRDEVWGLELGTPEYVAWTLRQIIAAAGALDFAHRHGVIHRDIKPMNLLLTRDPVMVKIADFGLALEEGLERLTTTRALVGTVAFMAPEQIRGGRAIVDARTDIYALGVTLFELLTLHLPYRAETSEMYAHAVLHEAARRPTSIRRELSRDLDVVLGKALEKDPKDRYGSAAELAQDLERVLAFKPIHARPPTSATRLVKWIRRKPLHASLAAVLVVGVPAVSYLSVRAAQHARLVTRMEMEQLMEEAKRLTRNNQPRAAVDLLSKILDRDPKDTAALRTRSLNYRKIALAEEDAVERNRARDLALADASALVALEPRSAWPYRLRGFLLSESGRADEAARDDGQSARLRETSPPTASEIEIDGTLALEKGDYTSAVRLFSEVIERLPGSVDAYYSRAIAYQELGDLAKARVDLQVAVALQPGRIETHYALARVSALAGDLEAAASNYREALRIDPRRTDVLTGLADLLIRQGERKALAGNGAEALRDFRSAQARAEEALVKDAGNPWAHLNLGVSLMAENDLLPERDPSLIAKALDHYQKAISAWQASGGNPRADEYAAALTNVCDALIETHDLDRALPACRKVRRLFPSRASAAYNLGGVYALLGRKEEALAELESDFDLGDRDHEYLAADEWFKSLRGEPRFAKLLERMKSGPTSP